MKKLIIGLLSIILITGTSQAQDAKALQKAAKKALGKATRALGAYNLDPTNNKAKLSEAKDAVDSALENTEGAKISKAWQTKGEIYNEIATQIVAVKQLGVGSLDELPKVENPGLEAFKAFQKAVEFSQKNYEVKEAVKGMTVAQSNLSNLGVFKYDDKDFSGSFESFRAVLKAHDLIKENGGTSSLDAEEDGYNNQMYITGLSALNADRTDEAKEFFEKLYEMNYDKPAIYEALYKIKGGTETADAYKYLETGREKYPDDVSLLFADINHHLKTNQLDVLIEKLNTAIEKEPENVSLYSTLGNVYDNLYQKELEAKNEEKAQEFFDKALSNYSSALDKKPDFFDAIYSIGALYYNKAAAMTAELNGFSDFSKKGQEKYDAMQKSVEEQFDSALPYFKRAEKMNPSDLNTLIALKEIFARKNDFDTSNEFKDRFERAKAGEVIESSYFNE